jgi:hypothetical protein
MSSGNPNHPPSSEQDHISKTSQYYNILYNKLHQSKSAEVLHNISLQTFHSKLTNFKFSYYNHSSGVALVTLLQTPKHGALPKSQTNYSSSTRLNRTKRGRVDSGMQAQGIKIGFQRDLRFFCVKATKSESLKSMFYFIVSYYRM